MKAIIRFMALLVLSIILVGCAVEETISFKKESEGMTSALTLTHRGDKVIRQTIENEMEYSALGVTSKEDISAIFDAYSILYNDVEGIEHSIDYQNDKVIEKLTIDYENTNFDAAKGLPGVNIDGDSTSNISLKKSEEELLARGYEELA